MKNPEIAVLILAAGKGTRMKSDIPKVLHTLHGRPLASWVLAAASGLSPSRVIAIVGYKGDMVRKALGTGTAEFVEQKEQLGTAHAVMQASEALADFKGMVLVLSGDVPLIRTETLETMISRSSEAGAKVALLTMEMEDPSGYGRIVRDEKGDVVSIVEESDANVWQKKIREVNAGVYIFDCEYLYTLLPRISSGNEQGEYYLTDVVELAHKQGERVVAIKIDDPSEVMGINRPEDLEKIDVLLSSGKGTNECRAW